MIYPGWPTSASTRPNQPQSIKELLTTADLLPVRRAARLHGRHTTAAAKAAADRTINMSAWLVFVGEERNPNRQTPATQQRVKAVINLGCVAAAVCEVTTVVVSPTATTVIIQFHPATPPQTTTYQLHPAHHPRQTPPPATSI
ncbi:hypothetical protein Pcinc_044314 [Petrolisthes cinctipes]|uniref:Uncharacterized protein n=1 Tax=Petrolisthes cinctipes TaxID=88211 RepID=A0AAE1BEH0_PETCI|nr:hypothetical protein Pcinc_044314 [Petrolisthes cinctipes]